MPTPGATYFNVGLAVHAVAENLVKLEKDGTKPTEQTAFEILEKHCQVQMYRS